MDRLYPELIDQIIDHLWDDRISLSKSGQVCQVFLPSARFHLFRTATIAPSDDIDTIQSVFGDRGDSPLVKCVRDLYVLGHQTTDRDAVYANTHSRHWISLPYFHCVKSLSVSHLGWDSNSPDMPQWIQQHLPGLTSLSLLNIDLDDVYHFHRLIGSSPLLTTLKLRMAPYFAPGTNNFTFMDEYNLPMPSLRELQIHADDVPAFNQWFSSLPLLGLPLLHTLHLVDFSTFWTEYTSTFLRRWCSGLHHLTFEADHFGFSRSIPGLWDYLLGFT